MDFTALTQRECSSVRIAAPDNSVRFGKAVLITTAVLWLLDGLSEGSLGPENALGIAVWTAAVIGALTIAAGRLEAQRTPVWRQLVILAFTAGAASSLAHVSFVLVSMVLPETFAREPERALAATALVGFFDGDALFGFWALLVELPRRIGAERRLERERHVLLQEAEHARIRAALEPHFVLNTLNTIAGLVTEDPRRARDLIAALGDLLRDAVQDPRRSLHTVRDEVRWLRAFARIMESRHTGRLAFEWKVDASLEGCALPVLLLQPLLENAVRHGALRCEGLGRVALRISGDANQLFCAVEDNGPGFDPDGARRDRSGLELVRRRLALESASAALNIDSKPGTTCVELALPRRIA